MLKQILSKLGYMKKPKFKRGDIVQWRLDSERSIYEIRQIIYPDKFFCDYDNYEYKKLYVYTVIKIADGSIYDFREDQLLLVDKYCPKCNQVYLKGKNYG